MDDKKALICKEPQLREEAAAERIKLLEVEEELFDVIDNLCAAEAALASFKKKECDPVLMPLKKRLENIKTLLFAHEKVVSEQENLQPVKEKEDEKELKSLYRKLASMYHPDKNRSAKEKKFFLARMKEINDAFMRRDLTSLRRIFSRASRELEGEKSALSVIKAIREEIYITRELKKLYQKKLEIFKSSEEYSLLTLSREDFLKKLAKMELKLKAEIYAYSRILFK